MKLEQIYTGCLAQGTYYLVSENEAAIIDPLRDIQPYLERLQKDNVQLKYIFETHFHADFVSGHIALAEATGATIVYGPTAQTEFPCTIAEDNELFPIGKLQIKVLHTPGHTTESVAYLLYDEDEKEQAIFSGDTLFLGDVGRPDLAQKSGALTQEDLAGMLYDSLYTKILPLPDHILVYPAHGAGSACGKNMMDATVDTLGHQKATNYALNQPNKEAFISAVLFGLLPPPSYFKSMVQLNNGQLSSSTADPVKALNIAEFESASQTANTLILDTRNPEDFCESHIPGSINIGMNKNLAPWVGTILKDISLPLLLVVPVGKEEEAIVRLRRVGFDNILGLLEGGFASWMRAGKETDRVHRISALSFQMEENDVPIIDIRKLTEFESGHLPNAKNLPLETIEDWAGKINTSQHFFMHCRSGYRSVIAASILKAKGIHNFSEIDGGILSIEAEGMEITHS